MKAFSSRASILCCLGLAWALGVPVAAPAGPPRPIRFDRLSLEQGLSQSGVMDILQDRQGYVWLATEDGLNRYDGLSFRVYRHDPADEASLPTSFVWDLAEDASGSLWIATRGGLARWDRATDRIVRHAALAGEHVRALYYQAQGNVLWLGTRDAGLARLDLGSGRLSRFVHEPTAPASLVDDRIYALLVDRQQRLWVGTDGGLDRFEPASGRFAHVGLEPEGREPAGGGSVRALYEDDGGWLWVGTLSAGVIRIGMGSGRVERFRHDPKVAGSLAHDEVRAFFQDADGRLWVGTRRGLDLFDAERRSFVHYQRDSRRAEGLGDNHVLSLAQDRGGLLWVGTRLGGVHKWNPLGWQFGHVAPDPDDPLGLGSGHVTSFSEDRRGRLWIGTYDAGLYEMDRATGALKAYRQSARPRGLPSDQVMALAHDRGGDLWIGTRDAGLVRFDPTRGDFVGYGTEPGRPEGLQARGVTTILEDAQGRIWVGTYGGGLSRLDPRSGRFDHYRHDPKDPASLNGDRVSSLAETVDGRLWVGTMEKGLGLLDRRSGRFQRFQHRAGDASSLPCDSIHTVFVDVAGALWVGSACGLGLLPPDSNRFRTFTTRDGLPSDVVYGVRSDRHGRLWLSTNNGLSRFDPRSERFTNYGLSDGLQATEFNFGAWYQSASGELVFGGVNGFNAFVPERLRQVEQPPPVVLTAVTVGHHPLEGPADQLRTIQLGSRDKVLGIDFAALDYTAPQRNRFEYKLENFDPAWVPLSGRQGVTYTNLSAGRYRFRLKGANRDGQWSEELAVAIQVAAPPWATPWAFAGYGLLGVGIVFGIARVQQRKLARQAEYARMLELRVQERTRELSERQQQLERANEELAQASITDSLTGLANRRFLAEYMDKEVALLHRRYRRLGEGNVAVDLFDLAFVMIDIDNFKMVNDSAGHAAGDAVLRQFRDLLKTASRSSDIIVRWGGDEFVLVARDLSGEGLADLAERIRLRAEQHVFEVGEGRVVRATCSVGFACYPFFREQLDALSWEQVISVADRALYVAKASGRNAWVGLHPGLAGLPIQGLFGAICHHPQQLVAEGRLRVSSSLGASAPLVWETKREAGGARQ